jgi:hypothetical protein
MNYSDCDPVIPGTHPRSSHKFANHVDNFIISEISHGTTMGPFLTNPLSCDLFLSLLQTVPKHSGSLERRVVLDLSYPSYTSVNDGIPKDTFLGEEFVLRYPTVDSLTRLIREQGSGCLLLKCDFSRAYRQLYTCPSYWNKISYLLVSYLLT